MRSFGHRAACVWTLLLLAWCAVLADAPPAPDRFPQYDAIRGNVGFWVRVFSEWTLAQAVVHDTDRPELIYEVVDLPGTIGEGYSGEQKAFLEQVVDGWSEYLSHLQEKVVSQQSLSDLDKQWVLHVTGVAGGDGLEGAATRLRTQRGLRERFRQGLERSGRYDEAIRKIFEDQGLPADLAYLPHVESSFQWHARSKVGAVGLWQFTRGTGQRFMTINSNIDERLDPIAASRGAALYLREAFDLLQSWPLALTAYNHGVNGMQRAKNAHGDYETVFREYRGRAFGFASRNFYSEFLAAREVASRPEHYFPEGTTRESPMNDDNIVLERLASPASIARGYDVALDELTRHNLAWSHARSRDVALPAGTRVWLPAGTLDRLAQAGRPAPRLPEASAAAGTYVVRSGDTLTEIAARHRLTVGQLRELNDLPRASNLIVPGQRLKLPALGGAREHVVSSGDTLVRIAGRYGVRVIDLLRINTLELDAVIRPGQKLVIP